MDEVSMAAMHADPRLLEKHLAVEAIVNTSPADATTWLSALNNNSLCLLEGSPAGFDDDYELFSQYACAFVNSRPKSLSLRNSSEICNVMRMSYLLLLKEVIIVSGPTDHGRSVDYLDELKNEVERCTTPVVVASDFNLIRPGFV
ncbi:hypothetical protein D1007_27534 [Hordeum vulgare]|nr:hypothetical protein D1007_27534 [Hordeum vulgare]